MQITDAHTSTHTHAYRERERDQSQKMWFLDLGPSVRVNPSKSPVQNFKAKTKLFLPCMDKRN